MRAGGLLKTPAMDRVAKPAFTLASGAPAFGWSTYWRFS